MDASRVGTTLKGKWRIDRLLGSGGFASVYAATHRAGKRVAIKILHPQLALSAEARRRFLREAYAANAVEHPGVVGVSDDDVTDDGAAFLVMDLLEGETLEKRRTSKGGSLEVEESLAFAEQALDALAAAHDKGIVHRDLKPENLFVTTAGQIKVLDFGIARFREPGEESTSTQTGLVMGSPAFMAPEQARGRWSEVDARTDVYAMGATLFTLLSGRLVHGRRNIQEALIAAATEAPPALLSVVPHLPPAVAAVVDRALAFEPAHRFANGRAMREAVTALRQEMGAAGRTLPLGVAAAPVVPARPPMLADATPSWSQQAPSSVAAASSASSSTALLPNSGSSSALHGPGLTEPGLGPGATTSVPVSGEALFPSAPALASSPPKIARRPATRALALIGAPAVLVLLGVGWLVARSGAPSAPSEVRPAASVNVNPASSTATTATTIEAPPPPDPPSQPEVPAAATGTLTADVPGPATANARGPVDDSGVRSPPLQTPSGVASSGGPAASGVATSPPKTSSTVPKTPPAKTSSPLNLEVRTDPPKKPLDLDRREGKPK